MTARLKDGIQPMRYYGSGITKTQFFIADAKSSIFVKLSSQEKKKNQLVSEKFFYILRLQFFLSIPKCSKFLHFAKLNFQIFELELNLWSKNSSLACV